MQSKKKEKIEVPDNPTPAQLQKLLALCSNEICRLADLVANYKKDVAIKTIKYKREFARAIVRYKGEGNADFIRAKAEVDPKVISTADALQVADATYVVAKAELDGYDAQFVALRKIAELRKMEINRFIAT